MFVCVYSLSVFRETESKQQHKQTNKQTDKKRRKKANRICSHTGSLQRFKLSRGVFHQGQVLESDTPHTQAEREGERERAQRGEKERGVKGKYRAKRTQRHATNEIGRDG